MSNAISLLKANYCRAILRTANHATDEETRRLVDALTTEVPTLGASPAVAEAEVAALTAIRNLADQVQGRISFNGMEWTTAGRAVENWIASASR